MMSSAYVRADLVRTILAVTVHVTDSVTAVGLHDLNYPPLTGFSNPWSLGLGLRTESFQTSFKRYSSLFYGRERGSLEIFAAMKSSSISMAVILQKVMARVSTTE